MADQEQTENDSAGSRDAEAFDGRPVALVTGGARRVGKAIGLELARRGWRVILHANTSADAAERLAESLGAGKHAPPTEATAMVADLGDEPQLRDLVQRAADWRSRLDAVVNSAAIWPEHALDEATGDDARHCFEVNGLAPFLLAQAAGLKMAEQSDGGAIVLLGDVATGPDGQPYAGHAPYHLAKATVPGIARVLAVELARRNPRVRINAVLPGPVLCEGLPDEPDDPPERREHVRTTALLEPAEGGHGHARHVAHAVAMLVENPFITGEAIAVDGGGRLG